MKLRGITESYEGLEDADAFEDNISCPGCGYDFTYSTRYAAPCHYCSETACQEDDPRISECGGTVVDKKTGEVVWCCRNCKYNFRHRESVSESYEGLEDADEFQSGDEEFIVWIGGGRWGQLMTYATYIDINAAIRDAEILSGPVSITRGDETVWENDVDPMVVESSYEGLEDADEFQDEYDESVFCIGHGWMPYDEPTTSWCRRCGSTWCHNCVEKAPDPNWKPDYENSSFMNTPAEYIPGNFDNMDDASLAARTDPNAFVSETHLPTGEGVQIWMQCPVCLASRGPIESLRINENYEGLEDADEFRDNADFCWCGSEILPDDDIQLCSRCYVSMCQDCMSQGLDQGITGRVAHETFLCPDCAKTETVSESYEGLEDADQFDSGENLEEAEQIMMWMNNNGIYVKQDGDVVDIYDKHGVLEGFPDGRRFGDDIPVDRVVLQSPNGSWLEWFVLHINHAYVLIWLLDETLDRVDQQQWYTARTEQLEGGI